VLALAMRRAWTCQRTVPTRHGARELEARRPHTVSARKEEAEALREALTAVDRRSRAMRCLGGNAACQQFVGEAVGEGMR
jgi:hypothetical protein